MATITASTGSIDVNGLVTQLMQIERQPLQKISTVRSTVQTRLSAVGRIQSALSGLQDAARAMYSTSTWQSAKAASADDTAVRASASSGAPRGNYNVRVDQLAQRQSVAGPAVAGATSVVGGGTLTIQMGTATAGPGFTADPARPATTITVASGATLTDVVSAINSASAGVTATIVRDGSNSRLLVRSTESGVANAFRIEVSDLDGTNGDASGLSMAAFNPAAPTASATTLNESAMDASFRFGGMSLTSATNKIENVVQNTTIELRKQGPETIDVNVELDEESIRKTVDKFVSAYNELNKLISDFTSYDATAKKGGTLQGYRSVLTIQSQMRGIISGTMPTGALTRLSDAGIEVQRDGSLQVNSSRFTQALATPQNLQTLFGNNDLTTPANNGLARRITDMATQMLGTDGLISGSTQTLQRRITDLDQQKSRLETRLVQIEDRLRKTYSALDANVSRTSSQGQALNRLNN